MWQLVALGALLGLSAFFSASETALMSLSKIRLRHMVEEEVKGAEQISKLIANPSRLLGTILIGNNAVNIGASALATALAISIFKEKGVMMATIIMTILVIIFAEITPKSLAAQNSEKVALKVAKPIGLLISILNPIVLVFTYITHMLIRMMGGDPNKAQPFITEEELKTIVDVGEEEGVLEVDERKMIYNVFEFGDSPVHDMMVQRTDIVALELQSTYQEVLEVIRREQFSRIPIYQEAIDDIVGILNVKDLLLNDNTQDQFHIEKYMREPYFTYEFKKAAELFKEINKNRNHMAVVLDEYGGTAGIVTIEDLIEEIVGDIQDEYDDEYEEEIEVVKEDEFTTNGSTKIQTVNEMIGTRLESEEFDSIGGFIIGILGRFPELGETVEHETIRIIVEEIDKNRIKKIRIFT